MNTSKFSNRLIYKLIVSCLGVLLIAGIGYTLSTLYFANKYFAETNQRLHANLAQDLIDEKFIAQSPIDSLGQVNKALFGDIMHDMMAVNRAIEVYLLDQNGKVQYSVVLDHNNPNSSPKKVDLSPIKQFIKTKGRGYILGEDPRNPGKKKVFSAAAFEKNGAKGYIYIVLAGQQYLATQQTLFGSYALKMGAGTSLLTLIFSGLLGALAIWVLTRNMRQINFAAQRFNQGDFAYRIPKKNSKAVTGLAQTFNSMADTIVADNKKIKSLEKLRTELIANISHDLRTPLAIIQGYIETMQMKKESLSAAEQEDYLQKINTSSGKLGKLVTQLFEYSKLESNQITPNKEAFLISELANDLYRSYQVLAAKKNIQIQLNMQAKNHLVFADIALVERALQNLLDNALKYTPNGGNILMGIKPLNNLIEITVKDSGPGIAKEKQALVFERYHQLKSGKEKEGTGLGLAIVRKIMDLHNASIQVFSQPNSGTAFKFSLPVYELP